MSLDLIKESMFNEEIRRKNMVVNNSHSKILLFRIVEETRVEDPKVM